jgi:xanthine/CO dehydrogenase XdhC/CoxF family maturation factor
LTAEVTQVRDILSRISKWWEAGESFGLATVARTYRSVSGGCVEGAVYELSLDVCQTGTPVLQTYRVSDDDAFAVGLTCGGLSTFSSSGSTGQASPSSARSPRPSSAASRWRSRP